MESKCIPVRFHMQWVISLDYEVGTEKLTAATESAVFIIDTHVSGHE